MLYFNICSHHCVSCLVDHRLRHSPSRVSWRSSANMCLCDAFTQPCADMKPDRSGLYISQWRQNLETYSRVSVCQNHAQCKLPTSEKITVAIFSRFHGKHVLRKEGRVKGDDPRGIGEIERRVSGFSFVCNRFQASIFPRGSPKWAPLWAP